MARNENHVRMYEMCVWKQQKRIKMKSMIKLGVECVL